jgi:cation diffusion facilitator CzcD-associated flavoprotein CzcO
LFFARFPIVQQLVRAAVYWAAESTALVFSYRWPFRFIHQYLVRFNLQWQVPDESLRKKLTPDWEFGCKRMLLTNDWYSTLQKDNVQLVTDRISKLRAHSIVTRQGDEYPVDVIIWSTGFQTQAFPLPVYGRNGCSLQKQWARTMQVSTVRC